MKPLRQILFEDLSVKSHHLWDVQWLLLASGDLKKHQYNCMTVGWGSLGTMWNRPFAQVVVRPVRYTFGFMEKYDTFTLCAFPEKYHDALSLLGKKSGRDGDKIAEAGLTPVASIKVPAPCFAEAELVIECRKMYWSDIDPRHFLDPKIAKHYPKHDYHRAYFGEILAIRGKKRFGAKGFFW